MTYLNRLSWVAALLLVACCSELASAAEPPSDLCSLLPSATVGKILRQAYDSPKKSVAPRPYRNTNEGTDCNYGSGSSLLLFRVYVDPSPAASADLFARLKSFFGQGSTPVNGLGDEAYLTSSWAACPQRQNPLFSGWCGNAQTENRPRRRDRSATLSRIRACCPSLASRNDANLGHASVI